MRLLLPAYHLRDARCSLFIPRLQSSVLSSRFSTLHLSLSYLSFSMSSTATIPFSVLSASCGMEVSSVCLGCGTFRTAEADTSKSWLPASTPEASQEIMDRYFAAGGNFFDVSNNYQSANYSLAPCLAPPAHCASMQLSTVLTGE